MMTSVVPAVKRRDGASCENTLSATVTKDVVSRKRVLYDACVGHGIGVEDVAVVDEVIGKEDAIDSHARTYVTARA